MHDTAEIFQLLQIAALAQQWPELHPIRDRAMEKLRTIAQEPAHQPAQQAKPAVAQPKRDLNG